jgi:hypothetical protein
LCEGRMVRALVDTGCSRTIVSKRYASMRVKKKCVRKW